MMLFVCNSGRKGGVEYTGDSLESRLGFGATAGGVMDW